MPIAFDATASGSVNAATSLTFSHTCTGSLLILVVAGETGNQTNADVITGITYNGVAMTRINTASIQRRAYLYYLLAPATGANNIVISTNTTVDIRGASASYTGAKQSGVPDASSTNTANPVTSITTSTTTVADGCWVVSANSNDQGTPTAGTGLTARSTLSTCGIGDNNAAKTPAGAVSLTWNIPASGATEICQASFVPDSFASVSVEMWHPAPNQGYRIKDEVVGY